MPPDTSASIKSARRRPVKSRFEARALDPARRKEIVDALQARLAEYPTYAPLGQYNMPVARRTNVTGNLESPATVFWNVKKN